VSITDPQGNSSLRRRSGHAPLGFKGSRKSTPSPLQLARRERRRKAQEHGVKKVDVFVKGRVRARETAIRSLQAAGLEVARLSDVTPQPTTAAVRPRRRGSRRRRDSWLVTTRTRHAQVARLGVDLVGGDQSFEKRPYARQHGRARRQRKANTANSCRRKQRPASPTA